MVRNGLTVSAAVGCQTGSTLALREPHPRGRDRDDDPISTAL